MDVSIVALVVAVLALVVGAAALIAARGAMAAQRASAARLAELEGALARAGEQAQGLERRVAELAGVAGVAGLAREVEALRGRVEAAEGRLRESVAVPPPIPSGRSVAKLEDLRATLRAQAAEAAAAEAGAGAGASAEPA